MRKLVGCREGKTKSKGKLCVEEEEGADDGRPKLPFKTKTGMSNKVARWL